MIMGNAIKSHEIFFILPVLFLLKKVGGGVIMAKSQN